MGLVILILLSVAACLDVFLAKSAAIGMVFMISSGVLWLLTLKGEDVFWDRESIRGLLDSMVSRLLYTVEYEPVMTNAVLRMLHCALVITLWKLFVEPGFELLQASQEIIKLYRARRFSGSRKKSFKRLGRFMLYQAREGRFPYNLLFIIQGTLVCLFIRKCWPYAEELDRLQVVHIHTLEEWLVAEIHNLEKETTRLEVDKDLAKQNYLFGLGGITSEEVEEAETFVAIRKNWLSELNHYMERVKNAKREIALHFELREKYILTYHELQKNGWFSHETDADGNKERHMQITICYIVDEVEKIEEQARLRLVFLKLRREVEEIRKKAHRKKASSEETYWASYLEKVAGSLKDYDAFEKLDAEVAQKLLAFAEGTTRESNDEA